MEESVSDVFFAFFRRANGTYPSAIVTLRQMATQYPDLVIIEMPHCIRYKRERLVQLMRVDRPDLIFTSFERALKHCGFTVVTSTHNKQMWKEWRLRSAAEAVKFLRKKRQHDEQEFTMDGGGGRTSYVSNYGLRKRLAVDLESADLESAPAQDWCVEGIIIDGVQFYVPTFSFPPMPPN